MAEDPDWKQKYEELVESLQDDDRTFEARSNIQYDPLYTSRDVEADFEEDIGYPGEYPFTRGPYVTMYRGRAWTQRNITCLRSAEETNKRLRRSLEEGEMRGILYGHDNVGFRGLNTADVDPELAGKTGTMIDSLEDHRIAMKGIPIDEYSTNPGDVAPHELVAMHFSLAQERGVPNEQLSGSTVHSDYLNKIVGARMFTRFPQEAHRRMFRDHLDYCLENMPRWNPVSMTGQNIQQAGATPAQEVAFTIAAGVEYLGEAKDLGFNLNRVVRRFTFFFNFTSNIFEEVAKIRAARRIWASELVNRYDVNPDKAKLRFHAQTDGTELTRQRPKNNISRVALQALAAVLAGTQSLHTDAYDEPFRTPSDDAAQIALDTQNIILEESDAADVIDPLGGSYFVESLTDTMEEKIREYLERVDEYGGYYNAVKEGYPQGVIEEASRQYEDRMDQGRVVRVGENKYVDDDRTDDFPQTLNVPEEEIERQIERTERVMANRDEEAAQAALEAIKQAIAGDENLFERVIEAVKANVTVGEINQTLWNEYGDVEEWTPSYGKE